MSLTSASAESARNGSADSIHQASSEKVGRKARACLQGINVERSTARGVARFLVLGMGYVLVFLGTAVVPGLGLKLIGSCGLFLFTFNLAMVGHDAGHGSLTRSAALNRWIGRVAFLVSYVPFSGWFACHNALHHAFTNLRGKDPFCAPLSKQEYDALSPVKRTLQRFYRTFLGVMIDSILMGLKIVLFPDPSALAHIPRRTAFTLERWAVLGFLGLQIGGLLAWQQFLQQMWEIPAAPVSGFLAAILLPSLIMNWWTGLLSFLSHTHPQVRWYADFDEWRRAQVDVCAVHVIAPWPISWLLGNALEHTAHHVAPKMPDGKLAAVQDQLEAAFPEVIQKVKLTDCLRILAFCKLYDYEEHRWLDYAGQPMSEPIRNVDGASLRK